MSTLKKYVPVLKTPNTLYCRCRCCNNSDHCKCKCCLSISTLSQRFCAIKFIVKC